MVATQLATIRLWSTQQFLQGDQRKADIPSAD
jgi:hypothetical protein